jgi:hypothetical protein
MIICVFATRMTNASMIPDHIPELFAMSQRFPGRTMERLTIHDSRLTSTGAASSRTGAGLSPRLDVE